MRVTRNVMHRYAMHSCALGICGGRGCYPVEDHPTDRFCDCPAGEVRRRMDDGEDVEVEWPACAKCGEAPAGVGIAVCHGCDFKANNGGDGT